MSALLASVRRGATTSPLRIVLQGQEGVGKTTWAAGCPDAVFLTAEDGGGVLDYARVVIPDWPDLLRAVRDLIADPGPFRTVVIDTIDTYEKRCWAFLCEESGWKSIEDAGFGKGYTAAAEEMDRLRAALDELRARRGLNVILLAHVHVRPFNDPNGPAYDRYEMRLHKGTAALWSSWADAVLFACFDATVMKAGKKGRAAVLDDAMAKGKAVEVRRVLYTTKEAAYDAKNRHGLPDELPLSWPAFAKAIGWDAHGGPKQVATDHHPSWDANRTHFFGRLTEIGFDYEKEVKPYCAAMRRPKPSTMDTEARGKLLDWLASEKGRADIMRFLAGPAK
jgi:hypothetical protein